jgi:hypothetical protein
MGKCAQFAALVTCSLLLPVTGFAQTPPVSELIHEVGTNLGFAPADIDKLAQGEIVSRELKEDSKKELAVAVAMVVKAPFGEVFERIQKGGVEEADKTILSRGAIPDGAVSAESFASMKIDSGELDRLLLMKPGSDFNLSQSEIGKLQSIAKANDSAPIAKQREAIAQGYREVLAERVNAYRKGGLAGIAPYTRGGDEAHPGKELSLAAEEMKAIEKRAPTFYAAFKDFPAGAAPSVEDHFTWQIQSIQDRPTVVLVHRAVEKHQDYAVGGRREFFVGQSFNSLQIVAGAFSFGEDTLVFYTNRTFTDQVAGFGSGTKHKIGREMMLGEIKKLFQSIRASFETASERELGARLARAD